MESLEQQLIYKNNEVPSIFVFDEYETLQDKDYVVFDNMLDGMTGLNIKNIVIKQMRHESFKKATAYLIGKQKVNIVWQASYSDILSILQEADYQFDNSIMVIIKIEVNNVEMNDVFDNICRFRDKYNNVAGVIVPVNGKNYDFFSNLMELIYEQLHCSLIISPQMDAKNPDYISWLQLDVLYCNTIEFNKKVNDSKAILMEYGILPARLLNEHPCNGYVCTKHTCHSNKNDLPRRLILLRDGTILPESDSINCKLSIGNISEKSMVEIVKEYKDHESHALFKKLAKDIYIKWIQTCPFRVIPWSMLFIEEASELGE